MIDRRVFQSIEDQLFKGKTILLLGARRVGKTHLCQRLVHTYDGVYYNCDHQEVLDLLKSESKSMLENLLDGKQFVVFDEAQNVPSIGKKLKILHDAFPDVQFMATGSSSFDLVNKAAEPLTGRSRLYHLYPLSFSELAKHKSLVETHGELENLMIYGSYPDVYLATQTESIHELENIATNYLYRDILQQGDLKRPELILNILRLLAFQVGSEVSLSEISKTLQTTVHTVRRYIEMLEKSFVLFTLSGFSRNLRKEIAKSKKYYFYDLGIRNSLIRNFNPLALRNDVGMLWENFCVLERLKRDENNRIYKNRYFWRTYDQQEIDYLEEYNGKLKGYEMRYAKSKFKKPRIFLETYDHSSVELINRENYFSFVGDPE